MAENNEARIKKLIDSYKSTNNLEVLTELVEELRDSKVHVPCKMEGSSKLGAAIISTPDGKNLIPMFTAKDLVQGHVPNGTRMAVLPFVDVNRLAFNESKNNKIDGIILNPGTQSLTFNMNLVNKLQETEEAGKAEGVKKPIDLLVTVPVLDNSGIVDQMESFAKENDQQVKTAMLNALLNSLRNANVAIPVGVNSEGKDCPLVVTLKNSGDKYFPVFLDPELAKAKHPGCKIAIFPFQKAVEISITMQSEVEGMVLVSQNVSVNLKTKLLENVKEINSKIFEQKKAREEQAKAQTDAQPRDVIEQAKFSMATLPGLLSRRGQRFMDELLSRKAVYIDELYENSYFDIRQYPYVVEEFAVTIISATPVVDAVQIEFSKSDIGVGCAVRAYIIWDNNLQKGRYFGICKNADDAFMITEVTDAGVKLNHGMAVIETNEMSRILEIVGI